jgi:hypothetical protein
MRKWLTRLICIIILVSFVALAALFNLGKIIKYAVNKYGPDITKTEMQLGHADVSLSGGKIKLENFILGNPENFSSPNALTVDSVIVDVDEKTLTHDTVIIDRVELLQTEITYEIKGTTDNFRTIIDNMKKKEKPEDRRKSGEGKQVKKDHGESKKKILIRDLFIKDIKVRTVAAVAGGNIATLNVSELHLRNIGQQQSGVELAQAIWIVLNELYTQVISPDFLGVIKEGLNGFGQELEGAKKEMESLGKAFKGLFDN